MIPGIDQAKLSQPARILVSWLLREHVRAGNFNVQLSPRWTNLRGLRNRTVAVRTKFSSASLDSPLTESEARAFAVVLDSADTVWGILRQEIDALSQRVKEAS